MNDPANHAIALTIVVLFLLFLPIVVITSRGRIALQIAAVLLCCSAVAVLVSGSIVGAALSGLTFMIAVPVSATLWFAGMFCALAAWSDAAHERRMKEMTLRMLLNDARGLGKPEDYQRWKLW